MKLNNMDMFVVKEIAQSRFDICKKCENLNHVFFTCEKCGCFMKAKVKFSQAKCPIGKW